MRTELNLQIKQNDWVFFDGYILDTTISKSEYFKHYKYFTKQQISSLKQQIVEFLLEERLSNYGYYFVDWQRLQRHRSKAKAILKFADINKLNWLELGNGFQVNKSAGDIRYRLCCIYQRSISFFRKAELFRILSD